MHYNILGNRENRWKRGLVIAAMMILIMTICTSQSHALSTSVKCEVFNPSPSSIALSEGQKTSIKKVNKYAFTIRNFETFTSLKNIIRGLSGQTYKPTSFKWISGNEKVARVSSGGKVTAVKKGTTYLYPIQNSVYSYKKHGKYVLYTDVNILSGVKIRGAFATKVTVTKK